LKVGDYSQSPWPQQVKFDGFQMIFHIVNRPLTKLRKY
jgi:hypothetical protein